MNNSVIIKSNKYGIAVILDSEVSYEEILTDIAVKFRESAKFFKDAKMALSFEGRTLTDAQEKEILNVITENSNLQIMCIIDNDGIREQHFKKALEERTCEVSSSGGQFYKGTLRSGQVLESEDSMIVLGDVNPGAKVVSNGNVVVLGALKGTVYAGESGNPSSFVVALEMNPMQIKIGDVMARCPDTPQKLQNPEPKIAFVEEGNIYIEPINKNVINDIKF
ncbi:septum site-determining protein MinC [Anaerobium acetethylicum]|uniref:Probable septum site-determining protein MinC n=1 Tax=Anaerobium acetethylicum TaxID=1619234 RepID=A0A1D3TNX7_9FIRM|nr:septum site-determining protein MinC [Anaerobium acetethylicum]SCP95036.1 septum site-determining protein MinC [Anaerobium acetethylicum]